MTALRERSFSSAKSGLSSVMDEVVHEHKPQLVHRYGGRDAMLLVRPDDLLRWLDTFEFRLDVTLDEGEVAIAASAVGILGIGDSFDSALDDLVIELRAYVQRFFERPHFYAQTSAGRHEPWLLRFALTDPDKHRALLESDIEASMPKGNDRVASAV